MNCVIRPALPADAAPLLDLIRQHATFEGGAARVSARELGQLLSLRPAPIHLIVAEGEAGLMGYAALTFDYALWSGGPYAHLDCLFVRSAARGGGIGRRLLDEVCAMARRAGVQRIEWQTPAWNTDAIRFYEREGGVGHQKVRFCLGVETDALHA